MDRLVSVLVACALGACSLSITAPAAGRRRNQLPECDTGKGLVAIDALAAVGFGVGGLAALSDNEGAGAIALVGAALLTASALHGSGNADKCKQALEDYSREVSAGAPPVPAMEVRRTPPVMRREPEPVVEDVEDAEPAPAPPVAEPPKRPEPAVIRPEPGARDWTQFWREVP